MPRRKAPEDMSVEELRRLLIEKRRGARRERLEHFRRTGRVVAVEPDTMPRSAPVVDTLYQVARGSIGYDRRGLRAYGEMLRAAQNDLGPAERFLVGRIEGLERVLSAL